MSTSFKIIENHIENSKTSPKKSFAISSSKHLSPSSKAQDSNDDESQSNQKQQILKMEIKQLQRQNKFLKKKINQLASQLNGQHQVSKKKIISGKGERKQQMDTTHLTIDYFFKQINNLMNSLADLFKIQFNNEEVKEFSQKFPNLEENQNAQKRYVVYKKFILTKKLQKLTLQSQQKRYSSLLEIFTNYYKAKQECDKYVRQVVDDLSARVLHLSKMILNNASKRKNSLKGSIIKSNLTLQDKTEMDQQGAQYQLNLPWTLKRTATHTLGLRSGNIEKKISSESRFQQKQR